MPSPTFRLAIGLLLPGLACAGDIYVTLREGSSPLAGVSCQIDGQPVRLQTASNGSLRTNLPNGQYTLRVLYKGAAPTQIYSSAEPAQYDFEVVRKPDGHYVLVRR